MGSMLPLLLALSECSDSYMFDHTRNTVKFREFDVHASDTIRILNLPPYTSVVFNELPKCVIDVSYFYNNSLIRKRGGRHATGFDTGNATADLVMNPQEEGSILYFAVTFPPDCDIRIVSNKVPREFQTENSTDKVCYFHGGDRDMSFRISAKTGHSGSVESEMFPHSLTGNASIELPLADPKVIVWSGEVYSASVSVGGESEKLLNIWASMTTDVPQFLELPFDPFEASVWAFSPPYIVIIVVLLLCFRVYTVRRQMRQRSMKEDEEVPLIHPSDEYALSHVQYLSCGSEQLLAPPSTNTDI
jgi:hypothetical protein